MKPNSISQSSIYFCRNSSIEILTKTGSPYLRENSGGKSGNKVDEYFELERNFGLGMLQSSTNPDASRALVEKAAFVDVRRFEESLFAKTHAFPVANFIDKIIIGLELVELSKKGTLTLDEKDFVVKALTILQRNIFHSRGDALYLVSGLGSEKSRRLAHAWLVLSDRRSELELSSLDARINRAVTMARNGFPDPSARNDNEKLLLNARNALVDLGDQVDQLSTAFVGDACVNWAPIAAYLQARLQTNSPPLTAVTAGQLLKILISLPQRFAPNSILQRLSTDGSLAALLEIGRQANAPELMALALYEIAKSKNGDLSAPDHPQYGSLQAYRTFIDEFRNSPAKYEETFKQFSTQFAAEFNLLLSLALPGAPENEIYRVTFKQVVDDQAYSALDPQQVVANFGRIEEILGPELTNKFATNFAEWDIDDNLKSADWVHISPRYLSVAHELHTSHDAALVGGLKSNLASIKSEDWLKILRSEADPIGMLFELIQIGERPILDTALFDALKEYTELAINSAAAPSAKYVANWPVLPQLLKNPWKDNFYIWLRDRLVQRSLGSDVLLRVLGLYGRSFAAEAQLSGRRKEVIRDILEPMLATGGVGGLAWLRENSNSLKSLLVNAETEDREILAKRMVELRSAAQSGTQTSDVSELAVVLGIELPSPTKHES